MEIKSREELTIDYKEVFCYDPRTDQIRGPMHVDEMRGYPDYIIFYPEMWQAQCHMDLWDVFRQGQKQRRYEEAANTLIAYQMDVRGDHIQQALDLAIEVLRKEAGYNDPKSI